MSKNTEEEIVEQSDGEVEQPKKKKKTNLRKPQNPEDRQYCTSTADLLECSMIANQGFQKKNEASRRRDEDRLRKQKEREEIKKDKRLERYERSLAKKNKLKEAESATIEDKKEKVRELYQKRQEEMGGKKKQKHGKNAKNE